MSEKNCVQCGNKIENSGSKYCSFECRKANARDRYKGANPDTFRAKSRATTGAISELRAAVDLMARGYDVFRALSPSCPCDLAVLKDGKLLRIEVRTTFISYTGKPYKTKDKRDDVKNKDIYAWVMPDKILYEPELE